MNFNIKVKIKREKKNIFAGTNFRALNTQKREN